MNTTQRTQLWQERMAYLQCEGYDEDGKEYPTLDAWLARLPAAPQREPSHPADWAWDNPDGDAL